MDVAIPADLLILLLVLVLPLVSHGVEQNLEAFLFVMGTLPAVRGLDGGYHSASGC